MEHPKKKEPLTEPSFIEAVNDLVNYVVENHPQTQPISEVVGPVVVTPRRTSCPYVAPVTASSTPLEFESSLDDLDQELTAQENVEAPHQLVFNAIFKQVQKGEEGGYYLTFEVPEQDRSMVATLMELPQMVIPLVAVVGEGYHDGSEE